MSSGTLFLQWAPGALRNTTHFVMVFSVLDTCLLDLCYTVVIIGCDKEVIPVNEGASLLEYGNAEDHHHQERADREDWMVILSKLVKAVAPSAQPFRMMGKGSAGRGSGPRLTDRKHYK